MTKRSYPHPRVYRLFAILFGASAADKTLQTQAAELQTHFAQLPPEKRQLVIDVCKSMT